jgi:hypothetical protein
MAKRTTKKISLTSHLLRSGVIGLALVVYLLTPKAAAQTPTPISSCGNVSGSVILSANLSTGNAACLIVTGNNTTIDGNGKTINAANNAVDVDGISNVVIRNIVTSDGISIRGTSANVTFQDSTAGFVGVYSADDVTVDNVTMTGVQVQGSSTDAVLRTTFSNNTVTGNGQTLADFMGSTVAPCPRTDFVVTNNTFTSSHTCPGVCDETKTLFMRCGTHNTVSGNTIRSTSDAMGVRFRDEFDYSTVSNNTFWVKNGEGPFAAFNITAGNADKHHPRNNVFTGNFIRADFESAMYLQSSGNNNTFSYNTIWSNDDYAGITISNAPGNNVFNHNTFVNKGTGRIAYMTYRNTGPDTWTNNIFSYEGRETFWFDGWSFAQYIGNNNLFHSRTGAAQFTPNGASLAGWKSAASPDDSASIEGNPLFTNATTGDFSLGASSPARLAATDGTAIGAWQPSAQQCTESWSCGAWSTCANSSQTRTCTDANSCGTTVNRPALSQSCSASVCTESWTCSAWGTCSNNSQSRTCTDGNACGTTANRPALTQSCSVACTENWSCGEWSVCTNSNQTRTCSDLNSCGTTVNQPITSQSCLDLDITLPSPVSDLNAG